MSMLGGYISLRTELQDSADELETYRSSRFLNLAFRRARDKRRIMKIPSTHDTLPKLQGVLGAAFHQSS